MFEKKIDFVVTWVDGNDPQWIAEKQKYAANKSDNSDTENRYRDWDLMQYWFRGVEKFAPWVNRIYFVTYGHYPKWLNLSNPKLTLVNHRDFMPEDALPTFNANSIELHLHQIPNLSEQFVLFNDDMFLISSTQPTDFFKNGLPCESALLGILSATDPTDVFPHMMVNNNAIINTHFTKKEVLKKHRYKFFSLKYGKHLIRNIALIPFVYFSDFRDLHLPTSYLKRQFCEVWDAEPGILTATTQTKFRTVNDYTHWLIKDWYLCNGDFTPRNPKWGAHFELGYDSNASQYIRNQKGKAICLNDSNNSLDFEPLQRDLKQAFQSILPDKSTFEL